MLFKRRELKRHVTIKRQAMDGIISYCKINHPNEAILILKGKSKKGNILVEELVVPPFSHSGPTFAGFPHSFLPFDLSYVGTIHSHPGGSAEPSVTDLNNFFGLVSVIIKWPYNDEDIFAWDSKGGSIELTIK
ncbi:MAG: peptidase [Cenarchaeum sp. SB0665_bin_23]|nr:peptidase [Cenarchaeum sp. SB0665_bin_23]MXZ93512.1 peptidase [Cenarchaeum sp. SB0666_bin_15]MYB46159.1 peptidase [Cenarchaeum sp. SB0662_bin_33]MYC80034.1 peptidase [Cenarchaeum sp. SB0661_bin_35]MYG33376.1 peptidase [Cenarchaeum sp. SB0677_bin_16]